MKTVTFIAVLISGILFSNTSSAQAQANVKQSIKVWGSCGMCKKRIEKAAKTAGADVADWDVESHMLALEFTSDKTDMNKIQESIAKAGYDTQDMTAPDDAYDKLHGCCKYDRKKSETEKPKQ